MDVLLKCKNVNPWKSDNKNDVLGHYDTTSKTPG